ncbi:hypothetical protein [Synechococcus sp. UW140]|nr:hypothetical protein [Synechococcus sp. UW140]
MDNPEIDSPEIVVPETLVPESDPETHRFECRSCGSIELVYVLGCCHG